MGPAGTAAIAGGLVASPIVLLSAYTLATTGEGLPPGPGGAFGAAGGQLSFVCLRMHALASPCGMLGNHAAGLSQLRIDM